MTKKKQIKLAAYLIGTGMHIASWRHPDAQPTASIDVQHFIKLAQIAERGKFDMVFIPDSLAINEDSHPNILNRFDPVVLITAIATATSKIGLVATASTSYGEPYILARQFASVDHISNGRVGWNVVTTGDATGATALNFSRTEHYKHDERYRRAEEFVDVVQGLWDSWEDDAFVFDKEKGVFFEPERLHTLDYKGQYFSVRGPLNIARSKQGHPVIVQAGSSEPGQRLAARTAEVVFAHRDNIEKAKEFYKSLKSKTADYGRHPDELSILVGISPIVGETEEIARQKFEELQKLVLPYEALKFLSGYMGNVDFTKYSLDTPVKEVDLPEEINGIRSQYEDIKRIINKEDLTVGELYSRLFIGAGRRDHFVGTPEKIADELEKWLTEEAADGFILQAPLYPRDLEDFVNYVIPILQKRGLFRREYEGDTLRDHLGLQKPVNRYTQARQSKLAIQ
ncbi:LLM class flavin-dependent oxidoreductase [Anoxybacillus caldiproteolyticus]|nr:LLM class flavin-dependent oxidoreductase [Anoxybacillus caldiproteolyticus]QPA32899.1 LLM class flavin-dependent oxidoreductase [Anoxybacillus caldiproteolyticus]